ncbi:hypothetical protein RPO_00090 [Rickettsia rickettsii str. Arizona]|uniref:Uncharacterized protein n=3 Tax=spotted fever group TaxID=114277 RepID=B0BVS6_RICRO|nr:hypothetical protein A1G_00090 [Rickettsia rickettsii str. 'Sheila Smith']ABY71952.1 hypothetical protein RrIowa_0021 [Rickettsia rickettsii str. Iowa]AFB22814.1 hypothetical protein RPN_06795 [Rickettsia rickettsii str. Brazil]AFB22949.1 hypothetical protein RPL_00090 [Rickettsia rickettsii str. Colombia]AFB24299.1 hypothetical protein RPO_00090 [Rickettsia rickettsii str. Arizona]AFB25640.1 hypothetical protein RSA_00080 [Rickettsia philipii str. 364D]AFB26986.1 hypothetical protein RPJ_
MYWAMQAKNASKSGFLLEEESKDFLNKILNIFLIGKRNDGEVYKLVKRKIK